ncbi:MAG: WYL domain-containing protein [Pseudomonadota bacterium]|nr:WYL domain-containing protein [Pseudomonadota bacterium]MDP1905039.1 WYL domain-containing protein [Pseudomonadota bacterium]MDP2354280.1 WYL domain-containing protein [Pseudomonadota bacterium]
MQEFFKTALQTLVVLGAISALIQVVMVAVSHDQTLLAPAMLTGLMAYGLWRWSGSGKARIKAAAQLPPTPSRINVMVDVAATEEPLDAPDWDAQDDFTPSNPRPIQSQLKLSYRDAAGALTDRQVDVKECDTSNPTGYLIGHCHLRGAIRTFRLDRIHRAVDLETGEIINSLTAWAAAKYEESPIASLDKLLGAAADPLRALFYIGKADGRFTAKEKKIFLSYCHTVSGDARITLHQIEQLCAQMEIPTQQAFKLICGRIGKLEDAARLQVLNAAEAMVATEKTVSGQEAEALEYLHKRLITAIVPA